MYYFTTAMKLTQQSCLLAICVCHVVIVTNVCGKHFDLLIVIQITTAIVNDNKISNCVLSTHSCY